MSQANPNMPEAQPMMGQSQGGGKGMKAGGKNMHMLWFAAACAVMVGGLIGALDLLFTAIAPLDFLDEVYLLFFGAIMFVLDAPLNFKLIQEVKQHIHKYARFLTRLTGRGTWFIFLGTMTFATLWENSISAFLAVVLGFFVFGVGVFSAVFGYVKSRKLERVRVQVFQNKQNGKLKQLYDAFARTAPTIGLTKQEFNDMSSQLKGVSFDQDELAFILSAVSNGPRQENISYDDLTDWCGGSMTWL